MNLTDLQMELRSIEEHISALHNEIEKMKPQTEEEKKTDFEKITKLAEQHPVINKKIKTAPPEVKKLIIGSLSSMILTEEKHLYSRLLFLCRLAVGSGCDMSAEDLYKLGLEFEMSDLYELGKDTGDVDYKYTLLVEAFVLVNLSEEASVEILSVTADFAQIMGCDKEEIRVLGMVAKSILLADFNYMLEMPVPTNNRWSGKLGEFISQDWIIKHRKECGKLCVYQCAEKFFLSRKGNEKYIEVHPCEIKNQLQTGSIVKKGDIICNYTEIVDYDSSVLCVFSDITHVTVEKTLTAPCDGVVYFIEDEKSGEVKEKPDKYIAAYVVSYFDDYTDFCKWYYKSTRASK